MFDNMAPSSMNGQDSMFSTSGARFDSEWGYHFMDNDKKVLVYTKNIICIIGILIDLNFINPK